jgi:hypothetical protein
MKQATVIPQYVELMPGQLEDGVLYISEKYGTAIHKCCCGSYADLGKRSHYIHQLATGISLASRTTGFVGIVSSGQAR